MEGHGSVQACDGGSEMLNQNMASVLHNKNCPYGYQCMALDCIECQELHEKVDTLVPVGTNKMKEIIGTLERQRV